MAKFVTKRDGAKEPFDVEKLRGSIRVNAQETVLSEAEDRINDLVDRVSSVVLRDLGEKREVTTVELKEKILSELDIIDPAVAEVWRRYDRKKGKV